MGSESEELALSAVASGNNYFASDLYQALAEEPGNLFFSPLSIQLVLAILFFGAKGKTAQDIANGLHLSNDKQLIESGFSLLTDELKESSNVELEMANKIYIKNQMKIKEEFQSIASKFLAGAQELDFDEEVKARGIINNWVENKTHGKIRDLIPPGSLTPRTVMVLVNAIYFKGKWKQQFERKKTLQMPFISLSNTETNVPMMNINNDFDYDDRDDIKSQVLLLPYEGKQLSMLVILPRKTDGLLELEKNLSSLNIQDILKKLSTQTVNVFIPKFKLEYEKELTKSLKHLGMSSIFDKQANFSGITDNQVSVSQVFHKTFINVNEEGTEAAAATGVHFTVIRPAPPKLPSPIIVFKADHPFIFFIVDIQKNIILFMGRYSSFVG